MLEYILFIYNYYKKYTGEQEERGNFICLAVTILQFIVIAIKLTWI